MDIGGGSSLEIADEFCYLGDILSVEGDAHAAVTYGFAVGGVVQVQVTGLLALADVSSRNYSYTDSNSCPVHALGIRE